MIQQGLIQYLLYARHYTLHPRDNEVSGKKRRDFFPRGALSLVAETDIQMITLMDA